MTHPTSPTAADHASAARLDSASPISVGEEINDTLGLLMPWVISFLAHFGLILLAFFVVWSVRTIIDDPSEIVPSTQYNPAAVLPLTMEPTEMTVTRDPVTRDVETTPVDRTHAADAPAPISTSDLPATLGPAVASIDGTGGLADGLGGIDFLGVPAGNARDIVFLVDASGSLIDGLPFVIEKLQQSIRDLDPNHQRFTVIFFQRGTFIEKSPLGLQPASPQLKDQTIAWMDLSQQNIIPRGESTPEKALQVALRYRPDLIYILSDNITGHGRYSINADELLALIDRTKQQYDAAPAINTIQYLYEDPSQTMEKIAEQHGGIYKFIDPSFVGLQ